MKWPVYVALNMDVYRSWQGEFSGRPWPIYLGRQCWYDGIVRPYFLLTPETYAWFRHTLARLYQTDPERAEQLDDCRDPYRPSGFWLVDALAQTLVFTDEEMDRALAITDPPPLPRIPRVTTREHQTPMDFWDAQSLFSVLRPMPHANTPAPSASRRETLEYRALAATCPGYNSTSGKVIFGREYPNAEGWIPPQILKEMERLKRGNPAMLKVKRGRT